MTLPVVFTANGPSGYNLTNSLRFRSSASAYLNRTPSVQSSLTTWTWSAWVKLGDVSTAGRNYFMCRPAGNKYTAIYIANNILYLDFFDGSQLGLVKSANVLRDPSAWYHIVVVFDTTNATASNRIRQYINGVQVTAFNTTPVYPSQNATGVINTTGQHNISSDPTYGGSFIDGYLAEVNFIDGQALTPSSFGSTNPATGVWQPAEYTGTYGTNGFYLPFLTSSASYAGSFNGTNQLISAPANSVFNFTGDFTAECWANTSTITNASQPTLFTIGGDSGGLVVGFFSGAFYCYMLGSGGLMSAATLPLNQWVHVAWVRSGSTNTLYINGIASATATVSGTLSSTGGVTVGKTGSSGSSFQYFQGLVSNFRVNNTAVYTSNFTPPTSALTAISGTQLLTLQNATIIDNSTNAFTITNTNSVTTSSANPFTFSISQDRSGNGNNWTPNNISLTAGVTYDSMTDVPTLTSATTANYAVLNPLSTSTNITVSNGNLQSTCNSNSSNNTTIGTFAIPVGVKTYYEVTNTGGTSQYVGVTGYNNLSPSALTASSGSYTDSAALTYYASNGAIEKAGALQFSGSSYTTNDVIGVAVDYSGANPTIQFYKNNVAQGSAYSVTPATNLYVMGIVWSSASQAFNFGQQGFTYTPPTGFVALNTFNLPTSTIVNGGKCMDATIYTGDGLQTKSFTNTFGFKPDLVWSKIRSGTTQGTGVFDSVRGTTGQSLDTASLSAEGIWNGALSSEYGYVSAFNSNGFSVNDGSVATTGGYVNYSGRTYVAWQWQAGQGTTSSNTSGSITSTVSVNATAGFSVVTYTGSGSNGTIGHGLGVAPKMIIVKRRDTGVGDTNWPVYNAYLNGGTNPAQYHLFLNLTNAQGGASVIWNDTAPTSSVFSVGTYSETNGSGGTFVAYCWSEIAGFSKFTSYVGNASTDGPFVYCGFRPKFIMTKAISTGSIWGMWDSSRNTYNAAGNVLQAQSSDAEISPYNIDILSNGFKMRDTNSNWNGSGQTFIVMAFAENPFKNALAR